MIPITTKNKKKKKRKSIVPNCIKHVKDSISNHWKPQITLTSAMASSYTLKYIMSQFQVNQ